MALVATPNFPKLDLNAPLAHIAPISRGCAIDALYIQLAIEHIFRFVSIRDMGLLM